MTEFSVTNSPPERKASRAGRPVSNPYRQPLLDSYEQGFEGRGEWFEFTVEAGEDGDLAREVSRQNDRIRAAGQLSPKIGTEVRANVETGLIAFRGVEYKPRNASATESGLEDGDLNGDDMVNEGSPELPDDDGYRGPGPV